MSYNHDTRQACGNSDIYLIVNKISARGKENVVIEQHALQQRRFCACGKSLNGCLSSLFSIHNSHAHKTAASKLQNMLVSYHNFYRLSIVLVPSDRTKNGSGMQLGLSSDQQHIARLNAKFHFF
jgi:hypothetical protein